MNKSENVWEDRNTKVKITIEITEKTDISTLQSDDILKQAEYGIRALGYDINVGEKNDL